MKAQPLKGRPLVSVVVPCYNYGRFLPEAVGSVLNQPGVDIEVIIVDDASTDDSVEVAETLAGDPRVTVVKHEMNLGHIATYNDGLSRVTGDLVVLLSADDLLAPGSLARAAALFEAHPEVGLVYGHAREFDEEAEVPAPHTVDAPRQSWTVWAGHQWLALSCLRGRNFILSPEVVLRSDALRQVGLYNPLMPHAGDLEYWIRTAALWDIGRVNGVVQAFYRTHGGNMHSVHFNTLAIDLTHRLAAFRSIESIEGISVRRRDRLVVRAERAIVREAMLLARRLLDSGGGPDDADPLMAVAEKADRHLESALALRGGLERRIVRSRQGRRPSLIQRVNEMMRRQIDRVRWTIWRRVGLS